MQICWLLMTPADQDPQCFLFIVVIETFFGYSLCLLSLGINPNKILRLGKNLQNWENTGLFSVGKQLVFGCKIGKIKSLIKSMQ